jgi:sugar phosphate isomerase/epimerase
MPPSRRSFFGALAAPLIVPARVLGRGSIPPSERVAVGIIGSGSRGVFEAKHYIPIDACEIVAVCDVREDRRVHAKEFFEGLYAKQKPAGTYRGIRLYNDFRELLLQKDLDAVYIATPDHWHVPITIAALQAGKDCHTEKPLGVSIEMDLAALKAVRKYRRGFLYGAERRSTPDARHALELVLNGRIGKVRKIYVVSPPSIAGGSATPVLPVPKGFDYEMWLGPAPEAPFCPDRVGPGMFHIRDYCLGFIANWAAHPLDQVQWWADHAGLTIPVTYEGTGQFPKEGLYDCAIAWDLRCTYENGLVLHFLDNETYKTVSDAPHPPFGAGSVRTVHDGAIFVGSEGWVAVAYQQVLTEPASLLDSAIGPNEIHLQQSPVHEEQVLASGPWERPPAGHQLGWIECIRARKEFVDPIESAVRSDLISQLSDICLRTGRPIRWDPVKETIAGDEAARRMMSRAMREPWGALVRTLCILVAILLFAGRLPLSAQPSGGAAPIQNEFFALDTAMLKDLSKDRLQRADIETVAALGYAGIAPVAGDQARWQYLTESVLPWMDEKKLKLFAIFTWVRIDRGQYSVDPGIKQNLAALQGRGAAIWLSVQSQDFKPSDPAADTLAVAAIREVADAAAVYNVPVSLYPHLAYLAERVGDAVRLAEKSGRPNVGVTFNLCHWLRTDGADSMERVLKLAISRLSLVTINGADRDGKAWIQPLDSGTFDVGALLRELQRLGYRGPIGLQGWNVANQYQIEPAQNLKRSMEAWKRLVQPAILPPSRQ